MGWKTVKERFGIRRHMVTVEGNFLQIGSGFISNLITIELSTGKVSGLPNFETFLTEEYPQLAAAKAEDVLAAIQAEDVFEAKVAVYTYEGSEIIEKFCETPGWPNVTYDGAPMYVNRYSTDKDKVIRWAKDAAASSVEYMTEQVARTERELTERQEYLVQLKSQLQTLNTMYPDAT